MYNTIGEWPLQAFSANIALSVQRHISYFVKRLWSYRADFNACVDMHASATLRIHRVRPSMTMLESGKRLQVFCLDACTRCILERRAAGMGQRRLCVDSLRFAHAADVGSHLNRQRNLPVSDGE